MKVRKTKESFVNISCFFFLFLFQSRCASSASTAAIFRQSAGHFIDISNLLYLKKTVLKPCLNLLQIRQRTTPVDC